MGIYCSPSQMIPERLQYIQLKQITYTRTRTLRLDNIERVHMMACKHFLRVPLRTPNKMVYDSLFVNSTLRCLNYYILVEGFEDGRQQTI